MGNRRGIFLIILFTWTMAHALAAKEPVLAVECPALTASEGPAAPVIAADIERQLRISMAWPPTGRLLVVEVPSDDDVPTYEVRMTASGMAAVLRILLPGQSSEKLASESHAMTLGARRDLAPRPIDLGLPHVLACRDLPGDAVEMKRPLPLKEFVAALRSVHSMNAELPEGSLVGELLLAAQTHAAQLGSANVTFLRQSLGALDLMLMGLQTPKVPCLRSIPESTARIDAAGSVRFYRWNRLAKADPFEDYAQAANRLDLAPSDAKDFLGKLLLREASPSDLARLAIYRALSRRRFRIRNRPRQRACSRW